MKSARPGGHDRRPLIRNPRTFARLSGLSSIALGIIHFGLPHSGAIGGLLLLPAALPEFVFTGWLLAVGVNRSRWDVVLDGQRTSRARIEPSSART